jgi:hypothetical protein
MSKDPFWAGVAGAGDHVLLGGLDSEDEWCELPPGSVGKDLVVWGSVDPNCLMGGKVECSTTWAPLSGVEGSDLDPVLGSMKANDAVVLACMYLLLMCTGLSALPLWAALSLAESCLEKHGRQPERCSSGCDE